MLVASGRIRNGHPFVTLYLSGPERVERGYRAMIDTGFDGSMLLPVSHAAKLRVTVEDSTTVSMADNTPKDAWTSHLFVRCGVRLERALVIIEPDCKELIIGMDFLRQFGLSLVVSPSAVMLTDESGPPWAALLKLMNRLESREDRIEVRDRQTAARRRGRRVTTKKLPRKR